MKEAFKFKGSGGVNESENSLRLSKTTLLIMQDQIKDEEKKSSKLNKVFGVIYLILMCTLFVLTQCRWAALISRYRWRHKTTSFP